jgi:hypothetical protein
MNLLETGSVSQATCLISAIITTMCHQGRDINQGGFQRTHEKNSQKIFVGKRLEKQYVGGGAKRMYGVRQCRVCSAHKKGSETKIYL